MSSARRSWSQRREDRMASTVRTPEDNAYWAAEGKRQQTALIAEAERMGLLTQEQATDMRQKYGIPLSAMPDSPRLRRKGEGFVLDEAGSYVVLYDPKLPT